MSTNQPKLLSGRVPVVPYDDLTSDRYEFLGLGNNQFVRSAICFNRSGAHEIQR